MLVLVLLFPLQYMLLACKRSIVRARRNGVAAVDRSDSYGSSLDDHEFVTFADIGHYYYGPTGRLLVDVFLLSSQLGFCSSYFLYLGDNLGSLLNLLHPFPAYWNVGRSFVMRPRFRCMLSLISYVYQFVNFRRCGCFFVFH